MGNESTKEDISRAVIFPEIMTYCQVRGFNPRDVGPALVLCQIAVSAATGLSEKEFNNAMDKVKGLYRVMHKDFEVPEVQRAAMQRTETIMKLTDIVTREKNTK